MTYGDFQEHNPALFTRVNRLWGSGERGMREIFHPGSDWAASAGVPFPRQARSSNRRAYFDHGAIEHSLHQGDLVDIDPRTLHGMQPSITRAGVNHYLGDAYSRTGQTYASPDHGNHVPVIYEARHPHFGNIERSIYGGHHRATAALLQGRPLRGLIVRAPYLR